MTGQTVALPASEYPSLHPIRHSNNEVLPNLALDDEHNEYVFITYQKIRGHI